MNDLIKALLIFQKYLKEDASHPTHCEHDVLYITCVNYEDVSEEDREELKTLGFHEDTENNGFCSYRYGSS